MSQSSSSVSVDTPSTIDIAQRRTGLTPSGSRQTTPYTYNTSARDYLHQPQKSQQQQQAPLARHYAALQEHADVVMRAENAEDDAVAPRHEDGHASLAWGLPKAYEHEAPKHSRNPMMLQRSEDRTPPTIEELVRSNTYADNGSSASRSNHVHRDGVFSRPSITRSSTAGTDIGSLTRSDTGKSIGGLARSMTKIIPDVKLRRFSTGKTHESTSVLGEEDVGDISVTQGGRKGHKLSFQLPSDLETKDFAEAPQQPRPVVEESSSNESPCNVISPESTSKCNGLSARRQIKMDLKIPIGLPDLSNPSDRKGIDPNFLSSITPARPRSPETPWIRKTEPDWGRGAKIRAARHAPVVEEDEDMTAMDMITLNDAGMRLGIESALPPVTTPLATPAFVRPPHKIRDRCYISRPTSKRSASRTMTTSESDFGSTPDAQWTPEDREGMSEQEARTQKELVRLAKVSKTARSRRWPWNKSKASGSDEQTQVKDERNDFSKSMSVNIFRRSNRLSEESIYGREKREKKPSKGHNAPWRRDKPVNKPPPPSASLANMPVPPTFVPPGCEKVLTPSMFGAVSEVRGKLADFFFEPNGFPSTKRKPKASPGGYWDSNAVLMSMTTDLELSNTEDDEEGPEGRQPAAFHFGPVNNTPGHMTGPGSNTGADVYLGVQNSTSRPGQDSWFRMHFGDHTSDVESLTAATLKEADERRKFDWLVPEHLPNSPLCPLHVKYVGPIKGLCYSHGKRSNGWGVEPGRDYLSHPVRIGEGSRAGWEVGRQDVTRQQKKKRRLESLSSP